MQGMSFREYLEMNHSINFKSFSLDEICSHHQVIADSILSVLEERNLKIIPEFHAYLK